MGWKCFFCGVVCPDKPALYEHIDEEHWNEIDWFFDDEQDSGLYGNLPTEENLDKWSEEESPE
jgi:hypothetical protein